MRCLLCGKEMGSDDLYDLFLSDDVICCKCRSTWERAPHSVLLDGVHVEAPWIYNDAFASALMQYKELYDEALAPIFLQYDRKRLHRKYHNYRIFVMPSSNANRMRRGFSHLAKMFTGIGKIIEEPFEMIEELDQKKKSGRQRELMKENIRLKDGVKVKGKILLCDDTMTTGSTLRGALRCLGKTKDVRILCASLNKGWFEKENNLRKL